MRSNESQAILLIAHGTRVSEGITDTKLFAGGIAELLKAHAASDTACSMVQAVNLAFLELAQPDISGELMRMAETGVRRILLAPLFLFAAGHLKQDIPDIIEPLLTQYNLTATMMPPFGNEPAFVAVTASRIQAVLADFTADAILLVGRGNKDAQAQADFQALAEVVHAQLPQLPLETGYLAGSGQSYLEALDLLYAAGKRRIILQPYLWFRGWLTKHLPEWVDLWQESHPDATICIGAPLGTDPVLQAVVSDRIVSLLQQGLVMKRKAAWYDEWQIYHDSAAGGNAHESRPDEAVW